MKSKRTNSPSGRGASLAPEDLRDDLIEQVLRGKMTTTRAEELANQNGLPPLLQSPDPAAFDPMNEPFWTIPMALAWIMKRDANFVLQVWDNWRAKKECWSAACWRVPGGPVHEGHEIKTLGPLTPVDFSIRETLWGQVILPKQEAWKQLLLALRAGKIEAHGWQPGGRVLIQACEWHDLDLCQEANRIVVRTMRGLRHGYDDVVLASQKVQQRWPALKPKVSKESAAIEALAARLQQDENLSREQARSFCQSQYGIGQRGFHDRVWPRARVRAGLPEMASPGRKPRKSKS
jgi:hypothetical protein